MTLAIILPKHFLSLHKPAKIQVQNLTIIHKKQASERARHANYNSSLTIERRLIFCYFDA